MLNRSNVGIFFNKTKGQLDTLFKEFSERETTSRYVLRKGSSKFFSNEALLEIIERENLSINTTQIITIANQKGGVGKTSTVISQARNLSDLGYRVLVIDTDAQANTTRALIGEKGVHSLYNIIEGTKTATELITTVRENLSLIPANSDCSRIDMLLTDPTYTYNPATLIRSLIKDIKLDFVLIDTSPSFSSINIASIASSNRTICPVPLAEWEIDGVEQVSKVVHSINNRLKTSIKLDFLITMFAKNETTAYEQISKIKNIDGNLLNTLIPNASAFRKAQKSGMLENRGVAYKETLKLTRELTENCIGN